MSPKPSPMSLHVRLRTATAAAHADLERALALLDPPPSRTRLVTLLQRFHAFHRAWEPALANRLQDPAFTAPRRRLALIEHDLRRLGVPSKAIGREPDCSEAADLCATFDGALGSLYVMEGSTLGGRVIARRLDGTDAWPEGGLRYFDPHGEHTGARWRETLERIETASADPEAVVASAVRTFERLREALVPVPATAEAA